MAILWLSLLLVSFLGLCLMANRSLRIPLAYTPFFTTSCMIVTMYVFGYIGQLQYNAYWIPVGFNPNAAPQIPLLQTSIWLLFGGGLVAFVAWLWLERNNRKEMLETLASPSIVLFTLLSTVVFVLTRFMWYSACDDVSHWSVVIRELQLAGGFQSADSLTPHKFYPVGCGLWGNYCVNLLSFSVANMIFAQVILQYAPIFVLLRHVTWKSPWLIAGILVFPILFVNVAFCHGFFTILADVPLGCWFGGLMLVYLYMRLDNTPLAAKLLFLIPPLFVLFMLKETALVLAGIFYLYVVADVALGWCWKYPAGDTAIVDENTILVGDSMPTKASSRPFLRIILVIALFVSVPVLAKITWDARVETLHLKSERMMSSSQITTRISEVVTAIKKDHPNVNWFRLLTNKQEMKQLRQYFTPEEQETKKLFSKMFDTSFAGMSLQQQGTFMLALVLTLIVVPFYKTRRFCALCITMLVLGAVIYFTALFLAWTFAMTGYEAKATIGGSERYPQTYTLACAVVLFGMMCYYYIGNRRNVPSNQGLGLLIFAGFILSCCTTAKPFENFRPWRSPQKNVAINRLEKHFPDVLKTSKYALYNSLDREFSIQLMYYVQVVGLPERWQLAIESNSWTPLVEPHQEEFQTYDIEYYFMANDPPADYWERNLPFFTDGITAKNYTLFSVKKDEDGKPQLTVIVELKLSAHP